jgi:drug/metabolite transporter (DMT)-like permease
MHGIDYQGERAMKPTKTSSSIRSDMNARHWGMLILLAFLWGGAFFFVKVSVSELPTMVIVFCRVGLAALALLLYVVMSGRIIPNSPKIWLAFFIMGFLNNLVPFSLIVWGQQGITSGLASILNGTTPIFTMLIAGLMLADERLSIK